MKRKRIKVDEWIELHVKGAARNGKGWGPIVELGSDRAKRFTFAEAQRNKRLYRKGFAKILRVTRYRVKR